jgi:hypothetical protein
VPGRCRGHDPSPDHARLQQGRTLAALSLLHPPLFGAAGELAHLASRLQQLLLDFSYPVREAAGQLLCALLLVSTSQERFLDEELLPFLPLALPPPLQPATRPGLSWEAVAAEAAAPPSGAPAGARGLAPYWETGVLQLAEAALAAPALEGRALLLLCGHGVAARAQEQLEGGVEQVQVGGCVHGPPRTLHAPPSRAHVVQGARTPRPAAPPGPAPCAAHPAARCSGRRAARGAQPLRRPRTVRALPRAPASLGVDGALV